MFLLGCRREKAQLLALRHTTKVWPSAIRTVIWHSRKSNLVLTTAVSQIHWLQRNVTIVSTAAISRPVNLTKLQVFAYLQVLQWSRAAATAEWSGLCHWKNFPATHSPVSATWAEGLVPGLFATGELRVLLNQALQKQCHTLCSLPLHVVRAALETF